MTVTGSPSYGASSLLGAGTTTVDSGGTLDFDTWGTNIEGDHSVDVSGLAQLVSGGYIAADTGSTFTVELGGTFKLTNALGVDDRGFYQGITVRPIFTTTAWCGRAPAPA